MEEGRKTVLDEELLRRFGAQLKSFRKGDLLFHEGDSAKYYYQIGVGEIKTNNFNDEGKEFIQGMFADGETFGEPPLLLAKKYPANAEALTDGTIWMLAKDNFLEMLRQTPEASMAVSFRLANRLYYKAVMASELSSQHPEHRLLKLIDFLKYDVAKLTPDAQYLVPLTRQQLADLTGLRVETVIRAIKSLEKKGELTIDHRKICR
jgi:CRP-like cAMP-binding protein